MLFLLLPAAMPKTASLLCETSTHRQFAPDLLPQVRAIVSEATEFWGFLVKNSPLADKFGLRLVLGGYTPELNATRGRLLQNLQSSLASLSDRLGQLPGPGPAPAAAI